MADSVEAARQVYPRDELQSGYELAVLDMCRPAGPRGAVQKEPGRRSLGSKRESRT